MIRKLLSSLIAAAAFALPLAAWSQFTVNDGTNRGTCNTLSFASGFLSLSPAGCLNGAAASGPVFSFGSGNPASISESYAAGVANRSATFTVHLERNGSTSALSVDVEICPTSTGCTAIGGTDYQLDASYPPSPPFKRTLSFAPGESDRTFNVHIVDDAMQDGNKLLTFGLSAATSPATISGSTASVTLVDDDLPAAGTVAWALSAFGVSEADAAGIAALPITRSSGAGSATVQVEIPVAGTTAIVGTHFNINHASTPFTGSPPTTTVTFANGATTSHVFLPLINNPAVEPSTTVALALKNPIGLTLGSPAATSLTITDAGGGGGTGGIDRDINGVVIPSPTATAGAAMCEQAGQQAPYPGAGGGPCGAHEIPLGTCSSGMTGANALTKAWQYNLEDFVTGSPRLGNSIRMGFPRNHAMVFRFRTGPASAFPESVAQGIPRFMNIGFDEQFNRGPGVSRFVSLSENRCDFDYAKTPASGGFDGCFRPMTTSGSLAGKIWPQGTAPATDYPFCILKPDTTYYLSIRHEDANSVNTRGTISCPAGIFAGDNCGMSIVLN